MSLLISVLDAEPLTLKVMRSLAVPLGHKVLTFDATQEASQQLEKQKFDVVFVGMPRVDGLEVVRRVENSGPSSQAIVVMLSATDDVETLRKAFAAGVKFVLPKPIAAARIIPLLNAIASPDWKIRRHAARLPLFTEVNCNWGGRDFAMRSLNSSESGMLLQSQHDVEVNQEVSMSFKLAEVSASLHVRARSVRKEGTDRVAVEFTDLAPEDQNAIQLYIMGRLKPPTPQRAVADFGPRNIWGDLSKS
jgi:CheY-like chemotaxis protein